MTKLSAPELYTFYQMFLDGYAFAIAVERMGWMNDVTMLKVANLNWTTWEDESDHDYRFGV